MNLKFTNAQWDNAEKTSFTLDVQDLDKEFLNGEVFPFTHVIGNDDSVIAIEVEKAYKDFDIADFAPVLPTLEEVQQTKLSELSTQALSFEENVNKDLSFVSSVGGYHINGDRRTRSNLEDLITYSATDIIQFRDYDNTMREVTKDQLKVILKEHVINGQNLYYQKWAYEEQIKACTTIEELNAIEFKFTMKDFSK